MITIEQLLESVDLDFEPRWVTQDEDGVTIFADKPKDCENAEQWFATNPTSGFAEYDGLKLSEFDGKDWTECIYEVPRKTTTNSKKELVGKIELLKETTERVMLWKINELVVAVNKHADIIQQIGDWGTSKGECLWCDKITKVNLEK